MSGLWALRTRMGPTARRAVRRVVDPPLGPLVGSIRSGRSASRIALTLDDGPDPEVTAPMLDMLQRHGVVASWFLLAVRAEQHPDLVRRIVDEGHEVALHGDDHRRVSTMAHTEAVTYLGGARRRLERVSGRSVTLYRPPYGSQSVSSYLAARRVGLDVCVWSTDAQDWVDRPGSDVADDAVRGVDPGGILLLHERLEPDPLRGSPVTTFDRVAMVEEVVVRLREKGIGATSVRDLARDGRLRRTAWFRP